MYKYILAPLDGSETAEQVLPHAVAHAKQFDAELLLLRVLEPLPRDRGLPPRAITMAEEQTSMLAREYLERIASDIREQGGRVRADTIEGRPPAEILRFAEENQVDLIVLCSRGQSGLSRWLMGSVADRVVRGSAVPILLVRPQEEKKERT